MHLKIIHAPCDKIDKKYQEWIQSQKRGVEVLSFSSQTAYHATTLTVHYIHTKKDEDL